MDKDFDGLKPKILIKGHCGHYHDEEDTEIVIVKIVKGKKCELTDMNVGQTSTAERLIETTKIFDSKPTNETPAVSATQPVAQRNIVPPSIAGMFIPPTHPDFESKGSKEIRRT